MSVDFRKLHGVISQNIELFTNLPLFSIAYVPHIGVIWVYFPEHVVFKHFLPVSFFLKAKDHLSHPYKTRGQAVAFYACQCMCNNSLNGAVNTTISTIDTDVSTFVSFIVYYTQVLRYIIRPFLGHHQASHRDISLSS
jgi:RsiW-degrading membrane proteinase PrsW (M82 family)